MDENTEKSRDHEIHISSLFKEFTQLLTNSDEGFNSILNQNFKFPEIRISLNNQDVLALIDSGNEISCLNQEFYKKNIELDKVERQPVCNSVAITGARKRSKPIKDQTVLDVIILG